MPPGALGKCKGFVVGRFVITLRWGSVLGEGRGRVGFVEVLHGHAGRGAEGGDDLVMSRDEWGLAGRSKW